MAGENPPILAEIEEGSGPAFITLNRPPLNILDIEAFRLLGDTLEEAAGAHACGIVVIRAAAGSKAFSAGAAVADHTPDRAPAMLEAFHRVARYLTEMGAVSIAAVNGAALGGGFELVMACDLVLATEESSFGQPEINVGCFPPVALAALPAAIGRHRAADLILTGRRMSAFEALSMGLVSRVVTAEEFEPSLAALVADLQSKSPSVLRSAARALRHAAPYDFNAALARMERAYIEDLLTLEDSKEGIRAFLEKRKPNWTGR